MPPVLSRYRYAVSGDINDPLQRTEQLRSIESEIERLREEQDNIRGIGVEFNRRYKSIDNRINMLQRCLNKLTLETQHRASFLQKRVKRCLDFCLTTEKCRNIDNTIKQIERSRDTLQSVNTRIETMMGLPRLSFGLTQKNITLPEMSTSPQFCIAENGVSDCCVTNYSVRRSDVNYECLSMLITSSKNGYRFSFKIYLNGFGTGFRTHLSVAIAIMKGPFDALLPWPFPHAITIRLINQLNAGDYIEVTLETSENIELLTRPSTNVNQARFVDRFVALPALLNEANGFLVNDALRIQVAVDTNNMVDAGDVVDIASACKNIHPVVAQAID